MPVKKERRGLYGPDWKTISFRIREAAGWRCEWCPAVHMQPHPASGKRAIITTAHMDHDETNNSDGNLKALCAPCHLHYDRAHHAANARATRDRKRGQPCLPGMFSAGRT